MYWGQGPKSFFIGGKGSPRLYLNWRNVDSRRYNYPFVHSEVILMHLIHIVYFDYFPLKILVYRGVTYCLKSWYVRFLIRAEPFYRVLLSVCIT